MITNGEILLFIKEVKKAVDVFITIPILALLQVLVDCTKSKHRIS